MTLFLTVGVRDTNHRDEFHITTFFRVRFAKGVSLLSTSEFLLWSYSNKTFRTKAFFIGITFGGSIWTRGILFHRLFCCSLYRCSRTALVVVFLYGGSSRLWWASVLLLSEPRQSVRAVRVPYRPSVFAPFCLKSAGLALIWASAVLLWFLALLYTRGRGLSIRRMHNKLEHNFSETTKKIVLSYKTARLKQPPCAVWTARRAFCGKPLHKNCQTSSVLSSAAVSRTPSEPISYIINR